ncbi:MAG: hypothetical protein QN155_01600 [Armatimonadota bacterium]|nr:hypothetical protein [Armatimonadota bacterium]MDR7404200.1 hypothetical protein [Armatimonadota bacterium]
MSDRIVFPPPPAPDAIEWPGSPLGLSNVITRTRTRTALHDKAVDRQPGRRDQLVRAAVTHLIRAAGSDPVYQHDVIIHGVRVRALTNSDHLYDFWVDNWFSPREWQEATGRVPPRDPHVLVYALGGVSDQPEAAYYSRATNTIVFFNTAYYGQLKSWVLGAVGRVLAEEQGIHSIHGACVEKAGRGILYIAPTGTGKSTSSYGLVSHPDTRFHSDDWVYVRYLHRTRDGRQMHPQAVNLPGGGRIAGYRVFRWLRERAVGGATVSGVDLEEREVTVPVEALDLEAPVDAYAFPSEKIFYLRTNLVENFPLAAPRMLQAKLENVPDVTPAFLQAHDRQLEDLADTLLASAGPGLEGLARDDLKRTLARLIAFDNARAMLDVGAVLPPQRVYANPLEPTRLHTVILLRRDREDPTVAERLDLAAFISRLLVGETPARTREVAYNAYRAVDDAAERAFIDGLLEAVGARQGRVDPEALYRAFRAHPQAPETLQEEFELFEVLHRACRCYGLNTVLTADPAVRGLKEAVALTLDLIAALVEEAPDPLRLTLQTYREFLARPASRRLS